MASSDNLVTMEPWTFRPTFADSWISETFSRETETLTRALQKSLSSQLVDNISNDFISPFLYPQTTPTTTTTSVQTQTPTISGGSETDNTVVSKRRNGVTSGKITKRKSRASKRSTTTFITADPANFRQMVQQVTGIRLGGNGHLPVSQVLKPEPHRALNRLQPGGCLPTLDTSAFLLDPNHHSLQRQQLVGPATAFFPQPVSTTGAPPASLVVPDGGSAAVSAAVFDFDSFCNFPTLESWN